MRKLRHKEVKVFAQGNAIVTGGVGTWTQAVQAPENRLMSSGKEDIARKRTTGWSSF